MTTTTTTNSCFVNYDNSAVSTLTTNTYDWDKYANAALTGFIDWNKCANVNEALTKITLNSLSDSFTIKDSEAIKKIIELVPQKVYKIIFFNGKSVKTILDNQDVFDPEYMLFLAYAKMLYSKTLTFSGVLYKSYQLQLEKKYVKLVKNGLKIFKKIQEDKKKKEEEEEIKKRKREKLVAKKIAAKKRKHEDKINLIAEAIRRSKEED